MRLNFGKAAIGVLVVGLTAVSVFAQKAGDAMQAKVGNTKIYEKEVREAYESPLVSVGANDVLTIMEVKKNHFKVRTDSGIEGFVQKGDVVKAAKSSNVSKSYTYEGAQVDAYLTNPTPVYIIDTDDPNDAPITLDRSFKESLKQNVDKETMERSTR